MAGEKMESYSMYPTEEHVTRSGVNRAACFKDWLRHLLKTPLDIRTAVEEFKQIMLSLGTEADRDITWKDFDPDCGEFKGKLPLPRELHYNPQSARDLCDELYLEAAKIIAPDKIRKKRPRDEEE